MSVAVVSLCSAGRVDHLRAQLRALEGAPGARRVVVWIGDDAPPELDAEVIVRMPPGPDGLRLAAGRNAGALAAGDADLLVFLDADCIPGPDLLRRYRDAAARHAGAVLCGPVTYLAEGVAASDPADLVALTSPHAARPMPADDAERAAGPEEYALFWSLSFALTPRTWERIGGFDEDYEGYGGEDTDFAFRMRSRGIPLVWTGGAHAYHQYHPTTSPPWQHVDDILRNGALFHRRWGEWPMTGWLEAFERGGAVVRDAAGWRRTDAGASAPRATVDR